MNLYNIILARTYVHEMPIVIGPFKKHEAVMLQRMFRLRDAAGISIKVLPNHTHTTIGKRRYTLTYSRGMQIGLVHITVDVMTKLAECLNLHAVGYPVTLIPKMWKVGEDIMLIHSGTDTDEYAKKVHRRLSTHSATDINLKLLFSHGT